MAAAGLTIEQAADVMESLEGRLTGETLTPAIRKLMALGVSPQNLGEIVAAIVGDEVSFRTRASVAGRARETSIYTPRYPGQQTSPRLPDREWWPLRWSIIRRDGEFCRYCGGAEGGICVDHVVPLSCGGTNDPDNLVVACIPCNSSKSDRLLTEWKGRCT
jgi:hypothetical protein